MIYLVRMRPKFRAAAVALVLVGALSASGCASEAPAADSTPTPRATPLFASDEEALAAAEEAYAAYLAVSDLITAEGGQSPDRIDAVVVPEIRDDARASLAKFQERNLHTVGASSFDSTGLQRLSTGAADQMVEVVIYACLDISTVRLLSESGQDVTPSDRVNRLPLEVTFKSVATTAELRLQSSEPWAGENFCVA